MNKFSAHRINTSEFTQKLHPRYIHSLQDGHPSGHPHNTSRACDAPSPPVAPLSPVSQHPVCPSALDDFKPGTGIHQPPHQPKVAQRHDLPRPQPAYQALHGLFGCLMKLDQLLQLVAQGHRAFGLSILGLEHLLRRAPFLGPVECGGVGYTAGQICEYS